MGLFGKRTSRGKQTAEDFSNEALRHFEARNDKAAHKCIDKAISLEPTNAQYWGVKGSIFFAAYRFEEAIECFDRALAIDPFIKEALAMKHTAEEALRGRFSP